ncbi:transcriptional regulator [Micromonospora endolithica]|uniref:transcriptional regulator n=1 Tax=Micromonospora endolithica TaxID=230091 RepID=UPI001EE10389|nr:transcriptional regulator [Micromonospora endolithica]
MRLRICGLLNKADRLDFAVLRDTLGISDATLSKHIKTLADSHYVTISKSSSAKRTDARRVTWLSLSPTGRSAFAAHVRALQDIADSRA